jgi:hypothetical protein
MAVSISISLDEDTFAKAKAIARELGIKSTGYSTIVRECIRIAHEQLKIKEAKYEH